MSKPASILSCLLLAGLVVSVAPSGVRAELAKATFAGGCFWCMQPPFETLEGVVSTTVGYTGGHTKNPTYEEVSAGGTGHAESVQLVYDPAKIGYERLLDVFWHNVDPLTKNAQFCDHGDQYRTAIFYSDETQHRLAEESKRRLEESKRFDRPIVTEIVPATEFYPAEEYHQRFHQKNPVRYRFYRWNCGRDPRLNEIWLSRRRRSGPASSATSGRATKSTIQLFGPDEERLLDPVHPTPLFPLFTAAAPDLVPLCSRG